MNQRKQKRINEAFNRTRLLENHVIEAIKKFSDENEKLSTPELLSALMRVTIRINDVQITGVDGKELKRKVQQSIKNQK
jgi:hypothetical protein